LAGKTSSLALSPLEAAILRAVLYADIFNFPVTPADVHRFLIGYKASADEVKEVMEKSEKLASVLSESKGYYFLKGKDDTVERRLEREEISKKKWRQLQKNLWVLQCIPFTRMIAVTGSLAVNSADRDSDFDLLVISKKGRVYLCLTLFRILRRLRIFGDICPNLILDEDQLAIDEKNIFIAREMLQLVPVYGLDMYSGFLEANSWVNDFFPSHYIDRDRFEALARPRLATKGIKSFGEWLFGGFLGRKIEDWRLRRSRRLHSGQVDPVYAQVEHEDRRFKEHLTGTKFFILKAYQERLDKYGLV